MRTDFWISGAEKKTGLFLLLLFEQHEQERSSRRKPSREVVGQMNLAVIVTLIYFVRFAFEILFVVQCDRNCPLDPRHDHG